jgi:hypothetical protein
MPGLDPGIPSATAHGDCRVKPGNDDNGRSVADGYFSNTSLATSAAVIAAGQPA